MELFVNTLEIKNNFCNGQQYEMQKSRDRGRNNTYKIFSSWVEEGKIPNTISYVKLFMATMKIKNNSCDGYQYEIQKIRNVGGNIAYKIFTRRVEEGYIPNTISYVELFMEYLENKEIISAIDTSMKWPNKLKFKRKCNQTSSSSSALMKVGRQVAKWSQATKLF